jgi:cell division protein FtsZ
VVATGIDAIPLAIPSPAATATGSGSSLDSRLAELTQKLRSNTQRLAERIERAEPAPRPHGFAEPAPVAEAPVRAADALPAPAAAPSLPPATAIEDVTIRPIPPKPSLFLEPVDEQPSAVQEVPMHEAAFIPPAPERPMRQPRMPRIEDLPAQTQKELRASRGEEVETAHPEKRRATLLQRLASVGLGRRDEEQVEAGAPPQARPAARPALPAAGRAAPPPGQRPDAARAQDPRAQDPRAQDPRAQDPRAQDPRAQDPRAQDPRAQDPRAQDQRPPDQRAQESRTHESRAQDPVSEYARRAPPPRPAPQGLDAHGRPTPVLNAFDDDQLEIPAFLRRQAN